MQVFDAERADARLARLLAPEGRSVSIQVEDTRERLVARPRRYPLWFVTVCVAMLLEVAEHFALCGKKPRRTARLLMETVF